jgi:hypothetical protein
VPRYPRHLDDNVNGWPRILRLYWAESYHEIIKRTGCSSDDAKAAATLGLRMGWTIYPPNASENQPQAR